MDSKITGMGWYCWYHTIPIANPAPLQVPRCWNPWYHYAPLIIDNTMSIALVVLIVFLSFLLMFSDLVCAISIGIVVITWYFDEKIVCRMVSNHGMPGSIVVASMVPSHYHPSIPIGASWDIPVPSVRMGRKTDASCSIKKIRMVPFWEIWNLGMWFNSI